MGLYCGIDISSKFCSICIIDENRQVVKECTVATDGESLREALHGLQDLTCVVEASPLAEWICEQVEIDNHKIHILCPRQAKAVTATLKKTDKRDAKNLAEVCKTGWYTKVHRKSDDARAMRSFATARKQLVDTCAGLSASIRGILRAHGIKLPTQQAGSTDFYNAVKNVLPQLPKILQKALKEMLKNWKSTHDSQRKLYREIQKLAAKSPEAQLLMTVPGVGPLIATVFLATLDDHKRFSGEDKVGSYLGLTPSVYQSGETEYYGRITKQGDGLLRWLLVEGANVLLTRTKQDFALKEWGLRLQREKGPAKARVAVARKLGCLLYRTWKTGEPFKYELA